MTGERVDGYEVTAVVLIEERDAVDYHTFAIEEADNVEQAEEIVLAKDGVVGLASHAQTQPFRRGELGERVTLERGRDV